MDLEVLSKDQTKGYRLAVNHLKVYGLRNQLLELMDLIEWTHLAHNINKQPKKVIFTSTLSSTYIILCRSKENCEDTTTLIDLSDISSNLIFMQNL